MALIRTIFIQIFATSFLVLGLSGQVFAVTPKPAEILVNSSQSKYRASATVQLAIDVRFNQAVHTAVLYIRSDGIIESVNQNMSLSGPWRTGELLKRYITP